MRKNLQEFLSQFHRNLIETRQELSVMIQQNINWDEETDEAVSRLLIKIAKLIDFIQSRQRKMI